VRGSHLPLFPGYVFLHGDGQSRLDALSTNHVAGVLPVSDQSRLYADLVRVYRLMEAGAPLTPEERLEPGTPVEITSGPLAGLEGTVLRRGKQMKLFVEVQFLQRGVSAEIEQWMIRALCPARPAVA
jgi:transcriptional antiterminator RfaH